MCGICGAIALNEGPVDRRGVAAMAEAIVHRGPDAGGFLEAPGVVAGIRRLRVIDLATGDQPIANEDGTVEVVFNGEIYNHVELRRDLSARGHRFRTRSDTEVLVHLWEERGVEMVGALDGMFAFCIVDRARRQTFLARDALGIKPLFVRTVGGALAFASEVRALLRYPAPPPTIDPVRLIDWSRCSTSPAGRRSGRRSRSSLPDMRSTSSRARSGRFAGSRFRKPGMARMGPPGLPSRISMARHGALASCSRPRSRPRASRTCRSACSSPEAWTQPGSRRFSRAGLRDR